MYSCRLSLSRTYTYSHMNGRLVQVDRFTVASITSQLAFINNISSNISLSHVTITNSTTTVLLSCDTDASYPTCLVSKSTPTQVTMQNVTISNAYQVEHWFVLSNALLEVSMCTFITDTPSDAGMSISLSLALSLSLSLDNDDDDTIHSRLVFDIMMCDSSIV